MNKKDKSNLIHEYTEKMQVLLNELEDKIKESISSISLYYGDLSGDFGERGGAKLILNTSEDEESIDFDEIKCGMTPQEIIQEYHLIEMTLKNQMSKAVGLPHMSDKYLELLTLEKQEARKALGVEHKEYFKLL